MLLLRCHNDVLGAQGALAPSHMMGHWYVPLLMLSQGQQHALLLCVHHTAWQDIFMWLTQ
jgi:hypothetical protein